MTQDACPDNEYLVSELVQALEEANVAVAYARQLLSLIHISHESLVDATNFVKTVETHQHRKIACREEIAYLNGWMSKDEVMEVYEVPLSYTHLDVYKRQF